MIFSFGFSPLFIIVFMRLSFGSDIGYDFEKFSGLESDSDLPPFYKNKEAVEIEGPDDLSEFVQDLVERPWLKNEIKYIHIGQERSYNFISEFEIVRLLNLMNNSASLTKLSFHAIPAYDTMESERPGSTRRPRNSEKHSSNSIFGFIFKKSVKKLPEVFYKDPRKDPRGFDLIIRDGLMKCNFPALEALSIMFQPFTKSILLAYLTRIGDSLLRFCSSCNQDMDQDFFAEIASRLPNITHLWFNDVRGAGVIAPQKFFQSLGSFDKLRYLQISLSKAEEERYISAAQYFTDFVSNSSAPLESLSLSPSHFVSNEALAVIGNRFGNLEELNLYGGRGNIDPDIVAVMISSLEKLRRFHADFRHFPDHVISSIQSIRPLLEMRF